MVPEKDTALSTRIATGAAQIVEDRAQHRHRHRHALNTRRAASFATPTDHRCRQLEWLTAGIMVGLAMVLAYPGNSLNNPAYEPFRHVPWMTESMWACLFGTVGGMRLVALWINGRKPLKTPLARMMGAFFGFVAFGVLAVVTTFGSLQQLDSVPLALAAFGGLSVSDAYSLFRASYDARYIRR